MQNQLVVVAINFFEALIVVMNDHQSTPLFRENVHSLCAHDSVLLVKLTAD
jgi:hypothetical protein